MAKRFTDTEKWKKEWYRKLGSQGRDVWNFLCDHCDHAGIWEVDLETLSYFVGFPVTMPGIREQFGSRITELPDQKLFISGFIEFQYGKLKSDSNVHRSVISILERRGIDPQTLTLTEGFPKGSQTPKDKEQDKDQEKDQAKEKEISRTFEISKQTLVACCDTWRATLTHFKINRALNPTEELEIARAIQRWGAEFVDQALYGARYEQKTDGFDPKDHISLGRIFERDKSGKYRIDKFVNLAARHQTKAAELKHQPAVEDDETPADPERVRAILAAVGFGKRDA